MLSRFSCRSISTAFLATRRATTSFTDKIEIASPIEGKEPKICRLDEAFSRIKSGDNIFIHGIAATPTPLLKGLCEHVRANNLKDIRLHHLIIAGEAPWTAPDLKDRMRSNSLFTGESLRKAVNEAMMNKNMPRTFGDSVIHSSHIDVLVEDNSFQLHELLADEIHEDEHKIGKLIAENLVENGSTLQMGIGAVPDAALDALKNHKDLGIHTEMFSDLRPGKLVVSFVYGSKKLYDYLNNNPAVEFGDVQWVNDPAIIRQNPKVVAINSAVEIDLTGQVVADSIGKRFLSGFGGQVDFIRGASIGNDGEGKPIIALQSMSKKGQSKIVPYLSQGAGVVTTRSHVHYVVTENGIAQLWGRNMRQRAYELIMISHPSQREYLEKEAFERLKVGL
ncbi:unnamed protein product [Haemonchus placei]|uniref:AcetylCoA_hyd_C domain-containing protein n=1 Tax=Haemonchus placei TaxID=6290 RepID=A0A0N4WQ44_HAEPC|nr:unnamed protein product [Haemonchus placei]